MNSILALRPWGQWTILSCVIFKWMLSRWSVSVPFDTEKVMKQRLNTWNVPARPEREGKFLKHCLHFTRLGQHELSTSFSVSDSFLNKFILLRLMNRFNSACVPLVILHNTFSSFRMVKRSKRSWLINIELSWIATVMIRVIAKGFIMRKHYLTYYWLNHVFQMNTFLSTGRF